MLTGLSQINIELTSRCDKRTLCAFCGHQDDKINPGNKGEIEYELLTRIETELPRPIIVQFHRDGEPTAYTHLGPALVWFEGHHRSIVTHGENLTAKADEIIGNCEALTVSVFNGDPDAAYQYDQVKAFLALKDDRLPNVNIKIVGYVPAERMRLYEGLGIPILRRSLHVPDGNYHYSKRDPMRPEAGICLDFLSHPSIDWHGRLYICNRLDVQDRGLLGDLNHESLDNLWNGPRRQEWLKAHMAGRRDLASPLCKTCIFWGVPSES